jgi:predicted Rossmann fold nucleotide-binding protein DprA/Smf involved in DNA uptake
MNVYILGIDHWIQHRDGLSANSHAEFEKLLRELVREQGITFIGDETFPERKAIAKEIAKPPHILWGLSKCRKNCVLNWE